MKLYFQLPTIGLVTCSSTEHFSRAKLSVIPIHLSVVELCYENKSTSHVIDSNCTLVRHEHWTIIVTLALVSLHFHVWKGNFNVHFLLWYSFIFLRWKLLHLNLITILSLKLPNGFLSKEASCNTLEIHTIIHTLIIEYPLELQNFIIESNSTPSLQWLL